MHAFIVLEGGKEYDSNLFNEINTRITDSHGEKARLTKLVR